MSPARSGLAAAAVFVFFASAAPQVALAERFRVDSAHTTVAFKVRHLGVSWVKGEFADVKGTVVWDPAVPGTISMDITIGIKSIDTRNKMRDDHLRSPDFFHAAKFPKMTFVSKSSRSTADGLEVTGDLTIRGTTNEVVLAVEGPTEEVKDPFSGPKRGASATAALDRKEFGLKWNKITEAGSIMVGEEVHIEIDIELLAIR